MFLNWVSAQESFVELDLNLQTCSNWEQRLLVSAWVSAWNKSFCLSKASDGIWNQTIPPSEGDAIEIDDIFHLPFEDHLAWHLAENKPHFSPIVIIRRGRTMCFFVKQTGKTVLGEPSTWFPRDSNNSYSSILDFFSAEKSGEDDFLQKWNTPIFVWSGWKG